MPRRGIITPDDPYPGRNVWHPWLVVTVAEGAEPVVEERATLDELLAMLVVSPGSGSNDPPTIQ